VQFRAFTIPEDAMKQNRFIYAGCDLGICTAKVVITENKNILACEVVPYKSFPHKAAITAMEGALRKAGVPSNANIPCLSTGFGHKAIRFADRSAPDITCIIRGSRALNPQIRTVIDIGGHSLIAANIDQNGNLIETAIVEDCAAGKGLFIEVMAKALEFTMDELTTCSLASKNPTSITNTCVVMAESEVISFINDGYSRFDVLAGTVLSVATRIASVARRIDILPEVAMTGGVAKNAVVAREIERQLGIKFDNLRGVDPQIIAAFGAALLAEESDLAGTKPGMYRR
jgi:predicted CoA-substrate-specific enzyme activase